MAKCKYCGRSGLFLSVSREGLCRSCQPIVVMDVKQRGRIINDSMRLIEESKKLDTQISRCDLLLEHATELAEYEKRGIPSIKPPPSALLQGYRQIRDELILAGLDAAIQTAQAKADIATTTKSKINHLSKALLKVREYKTKSSDPTALHVLETELVSLIDQTELDGYLEKARKAEFKGRRKQALDQYYEALYFLKHDEIDDSLQSDHISAIEAKIAELESQE